MKSVWSMALVSLLACLGSVHANLISNGGFETSWTSWNYWGNQGYTTEAGSYVDNAGNLGGTQCGALFNTNSAWSGWWQDGSGAVTAGQLYSASIYAKREAATSYSFAGLMLEYYQTTNKVAAFTNAFTSLTTDSWTLFEVQGAAPVGSTAVRITFKADDLTTAGKLFVDGASIVAVPEPVSATLLGLGIVAIGLIRRKIRRQ